MGPESFYRIHQEPATCPYPEPEQSSPCLPIPLVEDPFQYYPTVHALGLPSCFLPSVLPTKTLHAVCSGVWQHCAHRASWYTVGAKHSTRTDVRGKLGGGTVTCRPLFKNYEVLRHVMLQTVPFILLWAQTPSSAPCSDTPPICVLP